jgi:DNA-binding CsgD family transcriptional regulator
MINHENLRPIERVVARLSQEGLSSAEIGRRVGKRPGTVERILGWIELKRDRPPRRLPDNRGLRPVERVIIRLRGEGENYGEIGNRLGRSGPQVRRIEAYARLKS